MILIALAIASLPLTIAILNIYLVRRSKTPPWEKEWRNLPRNEP